MAALDAEVTHLSDTQIQKVLRVHSLPQPLILGRSDVRGQYRDGLYRRQPDGTILEVWEDDPPELNGALNAHELRALSHEGVPWYNQSLFDHVEQGWPTPGAHLADQLIVLRPYTTKLYQGALQWHREAQAGMQPDAYPRLFCIPALHELPAMPYMVALRSNIPKAGRVNEWRQIVNLSADMEVRRDSQTPSGIPSIIPSLNERLRAATPVGPNLEMVRCSDLGQIIAIFQSYGIKVEVWTLDVTGYFHTVVVLLRRAMEQGVLTLDGPAMSHVFDMGGEDCPRKTGQISSFLAECVSKLAHERVVQLSEIRNDPRVQHMLTARGRKFGPNNPQARVVLAPMYSDDMCVVCPYGTRPTVQAVADEVARRLNLRWQGDKGGPRVFIGYELRLGPSTNHSAAFIKSVKVAEYTANWEDLASQEFPSIQMGQSVCGQMNHAATVELALKPLATRLNKALHAQSRLRNPLLFAQPAACRADVLQAVSVLRGSKGIPLTCARDWPAHNGSRTVTQRGDACVKEEGYNGWGAWYVVQCGPDTMDFRVYAMFDT